MAMGWMGVSIGVAVLLLGGCDGGETQAADGAGGTGSGNSELKEEAASVVMTELAAHWSEGSDGWSTVHNIGSRYVPQSVIRQMRTLEVAYVKEESLSEANRLNGLEWLGEVNLKKSPCREIGPEGPAFEDQISMDGGRWRDIGRWTPWTECNAFAVRVQRKGGQWMMDQDRFELTGTPAAAADFAAAGVQ